MALSRPVILALLGTILAAATFFTVQNARPTADESSTPAAESAQAPASQSSQPAQMSADEAVKAAFSAPDVRSGKFELRLALDVDRGGERSSVEVTGAFQSRGENDVPLFDVSLKILGDDGDRLNAGVVSTGDKAWLTQGETGYPVPEAAWAAVAEARGDSAQGAQVSPAQAIAALGLEPASWVEDVKDEGEQTVAGVETKHVSATIDAPAIVRDVMRAARSAGADVPLPRGIEKNVAEAVKRAELDLYVGTDDRILRRLSLDLALDAGASGSGSVALDVQLSEVNRPQDIEAPARVSDGFPRGELGDFARGLTQGLALATGADPSALRFPTNDNPKRLVRAVRDHRKAVLFFHQGALDDRATAAAVRQLDRRSKVVVLSDRVENTDRYGKLVEDLGVNQAPAIVIVDRRGDARLIEGYVDAGVLRQAVADTR